MSEKIYLFQRSKVRPTPCGMVVKEFSSILRPKLCELRSNILLSTRKDANTKGMHIILAMRQLRCEWENSRVIKKYNWWTPKHETCIFLSCDNYMNGKNHIIGNYNQPPKLETCVFLSFDNYMNGKMHVIGNYTQTPHSPRPPKL